MTNWVFASAGFMVGLTAVTIWLQGRERSAKRVSERWWARLYFRILGTWPASVVAERLAEDDARQAARRVQERAVAHLGVGNPFRVQAVPGGLFDAETAVNLYNAAVIARRGHEYKVFRNVKMAAVSDDEWQLASTGGTFGDAITRARDTVYVADDVVPTIWEWLSKANGA